MPATPPSSPTSLTTATRTSVRDHIDAFRAEYGDVPVFEETFDIPEVRFDDMAGVARDGYLDGGAAFVSHEGRLLLQRRADTGEWGVPGGGWEDGETFAETAMREVREETAVDCRVTGLRVLHHQRWGAVDREETIHSLGVFFEAQYVAGDSAPVDDEVDAVEWVETLPDETADVVARYARLGEN